MLSRRTFLTTIAAAPLAQFCKTEPVRPHVALTTWERLELEAASETVRTATTPAEQIAALERVGRVTQAALGRYETRTALVSWHYGHERRYALPQGTLG